MKTVSVSEFAHVFEDGETRVDQMFRRFLDGEER